MTKDKSSLNITYSINYPSRLLKSSIFKRKDRPGITLAIASYRYGHLAAHCIESILSQTVTPARVIFVDDGAGDCAHLPRIYPSIDFILREKNLGIPENFQDILDRIDTEYAMFLGADNWLRSDAIELLSGKTTDIVTYDIMVTGSLRDEIVRRHPAEITRLQGDFYWSRKGGHHGSMMYRTSLAKRFGYAKRIEASPYPEEDWNLWNRMRADGATVTHIEQALLYYRRHHENFLKYA
ncbi:glycosyltransferase family 2 protein [Ottowia sp.]|uniref:glycosyltransferase family 2 protein n=1 Tax=Ottowia sp. TaxID=1898956 RepID=UPI0039E37721